MDGADSIRLRSRIAQRYVSARGFLSPLASLHGPPGTGSAPDDRGNDSKRGELDPFEQEIHFE